MKDTTFYNSESVHYSDRRYPNRAQTYTQFFFKRRLALTKKFLTDVVRKVGRPLELLEVGCADGVILREIERSFPGAFKKLVGIDIAPGMIEEAQKKNFSPHTMFLVRSECGGNLFDVIVETGVINYAHFDEEIAFATEHLTPGGQYIFSIAGTNSLLNRLKPEKDFNDFRSYGEYDHLIQKYFIVLSVRGCGLFIPYLWRVPVLARVAQACIDPVAGFLFPQLCHEKIYMVEKR